MKEFFTGLIVGAVLSLATAWYFVVGRQRPDVRHAQDVAAAAVIRTADSVEARLKAWHLDTDEIKEELGRTGKVVRQSARDWGEVLADTAGDARVTTAVKTKLIADKQLSAWNINVSTTAGHVTLSGVVADHEQIGRAMLLAMETPGVRKVSSTLQVQGKPR